MAEAAAAAQGKAAAGMTAAVPHATGNLLGDGVVLLGAGLVAVLLFRKLGLGRGAGAISSAGALIGPQGLRLVTAAEGAAAMGEIGIVLLLFLVGLELNPRWLWQLEGATYSGSACCRWCWRGWRWRASSIFFNAFTGAAALALGLPLALSSTAQVLPLLRSAGRMNTPFGERAFSILLFQDLSIVPLITVIAALQPRAGRPPSLRRAG